MSNIENSMQRDGRDFIWHISLAAYLAGRASRVSSGPVCRTAVRWFCG